MVLLDGDGEVPLELPAGRLLPQAGRRPAQQDLLQPDADAGRGRRRGVQAHAEPDGPVQVRRVRQGTDPAGRIPRRYDDEEDTKGHGHEHVLARISTRPPGSSVPTTVSVIGYNKDYQLDVYDADWKLLFRFGREFTPVRHPEYKADGPHPEFYPAFSDWRKFYDEKGNLWLEQYQEKGVEEHAFDVFSPEGIYLRQVRVPESLYLVRGDLAYTIVRQEDEFLVVKRFKLVPENRK